MTSKDTKGVLKLPELIAMGVGGMIGGGIFSVLGLAVDVSGHAAPFAFMIGSVIALLAGYSYIRLALTYRSDGASFTYLERAFPTHLWIAGIAGWIVVVGYIGTLALYSFTFGAYGAHLIGFDHSGIVRSILSVTVLVCFAGINIIGAKFMGRAEDAIVYVKIALLALLAVVGFFVSDSNKMLPIFDHGVNSIFLGGALIFVAYEGFQLITNAVCETSNPQQNIPRGIYGSILITSFIYITIAIVAVSTLSEGALKSAQEYALAIVAKPVMGHLGVILVDLAALLATSSAINATLFGSARIAREMATDSLAPKAFSFRNRHSVPSRGIIVFTVLAGILTGLGGLELIASFSSMTFLIVSIAISVANLRLHKKTKSKILPVLVGLILMSATVITLIVFLARNKVDALITTAIIYVVAALAHFLFVKVREKNIAEN